ncbi:hypothetical protein NSA19_02760 [Actinomyces bowdenii]|uniref:hypothetical protein n=1 Tax=Actinomyces bowdenii TaxID=131109 RepID=UPI00214C885A|nr:hypothetical protein [Actinomyces bowdenii]MCR2051790.1 hypothetical protein [Actinomyces bowdenii]
MLRVHTREVQARITCDQADCGAVLQMPPRPPSLEMDEAEINALVTTAPHLGWLVDEDMHWCPDHAGRRA